mgnify:FL=1
MSRRASRAPGSTTFIFGIITSIVRGAVGRREGAELIWDAVVALTKRNSNAAEILTFLHKFVSVRRSFAATREMGES